MAEAVGPEGAAAVDVTGEDVPAEAATGEDGTAGSVAAESVTAEGVATADLYDERGDALQSCSLQFRRIGGAPRFSGVVSTVRCHRDNALVKSVLNSPGEGRVLVVDGGGSLESALVGDLIGAAAVANGWAGVVVNGAVRDVVALGLLPLGLFALGSNPRKSAKDGVGDLEVPVAFGGVEFVPGATLWADEDGILVTRP